jgi:hypothetical protein
MSVGHPSDVIAGVAGLVVMMGRCQRLDPGSIPGRRILSRISISTFVYCPRKKMRRNEKKCSHAGNRTRVCWVKASYPNQLDYMGLAYSYISILTLYWELEL